MTVQLINPSAGEVVVGLVTVILGGGGIAALASLITGRALAHKTSAETKGLEAKLPAEVDSVVVQGAEAAVLTMQRALESAVGRIAQLEAERETTQREREDDARKIKALESRVEQLRAKVEGAERALREAQRATSSLQEELATFVREQQERRQ